MNNIAQLKIENDRKVKEGKHSENEYYMNTKCSLTGLMSILFLTSK